ncbi:hypothetical protein [Streptomyces sp. NPDC093568]
MGCPVFGEVVEGQSVVDELNIVPTTAKGGHADVPKEDAALASAGIV